MRKYVFIMLTVVCCWISLVSGDVYAGPHGGGHGGGGGGRGGYYIGGYYGVPGGGYYGVPGGGYRHHRSR